LGADAIEPDIVATVDGVLVLRHENEISATTDVADRPEFAGRRTTKLIDGAEATGWFTEDFTWDELRTLRSVERIPAIRPGNAAFSGSILRLADLLGLLDAADRSVGLVAELKHAAYFESVGLPLDELFAAELAAAGWSRDPRLTIESFEPGVLRQVRSRGVRAPLIFLIEDHGAPADEVARQGERAMPYAEYLTDPRLAALAEWVDGISVNKQLLLELDVAGAATGTTDLVERAHAAGLTVFCWTLRGENAFLPTNLRRGQDARALGDWIAEFGLILDTGVEGVFADQPDLALAARARAESAAPFRIGGI
jgi:glycerophosphoryl diester phosphodiesterase